MTPFHTDDRVLVIVEAGIGQERASDVPEVHDGVVDDGARGELCRAANLLLLFIN